MTAAKKNIVRRNFMQTKRVIGRRVAAGKIKVKKIWEVFGGELHVFGQDGPAFMIPPTAVDLQIAARESFPHKPATSRQPEGGVIFRLNVGFQTVEFELLKGAPQNEPHPLAHQSSSGVGCKGVIAQKRALQRPGNNVIQMNRPDQVTRLVQNNQKLRRCESEVMRFT